MKANTYSLIFKTIRDNNNNSKKCDCKPEEVWRRYASCEENKHKHKHKHKEEEEEEEEEEEKTLTHSLTHQ